MKETKTHLSEAAEAAWALTTWPDSEYHLESAKIGLLYIEKPCEGPPPLHQSKSHVLGVQWWEQSDSPHKAKDRHLSSAGQEI